MAPADGSLQKRGKSAPFQNRTAVVKEKTLRRAAWFGSRELVLVAKNNESRLSLASINFTVAFGYLPKKRV
jgi:hypothetical protein